MYVEGALGRYLVNGTGTHSLPAVCYGTIDTSLVDAMPIQIKASF